MFWSYLLSPEVDDHLLKLFIFGLICFSKFLQHLEMNKSMNLNIWTKLLPLRHLGEEGLKHLGEEEDCGPEVFQLQHHGQLSITLFPVVDVLSCNRDGVDRRLLVSVFGLDGCSY